MKPFEKFTRTVNKIRYSVEKSSLIASNVYWDGDNFERGGTNKFLYVSQGGRNIGFY